MEPWRVGRPVVADLHYFDTEQDPYPDPDLHESEQPDPDLHKSEKMDPNPDTHKSLSDPQQ
jgi:hypothetical protein